MESAESPNQFFGLITARAGSKRLPGKNLRPLHGIPLLSYTVRASVNCPEIARTVLSSDSAEMIELALKEGCLPLGPRPTELSSDTTKSLDVVRFELSRIENLYGRLSYIVLLQPTSPLRTSVDIENAIKHFKSSGADTLTSITRVSDLVGEIWAMNENRLVISNPSLASADTDVRYRENGAIYILSRDVVLSGRFYGDFVTGFEMSAERSVDVDTLADFERVESFLKGDS